MLSSEQLQHYRNMTPGERIALSLEMLEAQWPQMMAGPAKVIDRRFEIINQQNDERNERLLAAFASLERVK